MKIKYVIFVFLFMGTVLFASSGTPITWNGEFKTGTRVEEVLKLKGEPTRKIGPVGDPPIEKWYYGKEIVVIQNGFVIDSFYIKWE